MQLKAKHYCDINNTELTIFLYDEFSMFIELNKCGKSELSIVIPLDSLTHAIRKLTAK